MSSPVSRLRKYKRSPLPDCNSVPSDLCTGINPQPIESRVPKNEELLSSMARRLTQVEAELMTCKREIMDKNKQIKRLENRIQVLSVQDKDALELRCLTLQKQIEEMEEFLNDYGMIWVGNVSPTREPQKLWSPEQSLPKEHLINFDLILKHIEELNSLCEHSTVTGTTTGATIKRYQPVSLTLYKNGLVLFQGPFRPYSTQSTQQFITDLSDGYFPTELQSRYPNGVPIEVIDRRECEYGTGSFPGSGEALGGRERVETFLNRLPPSVVKGGRVVDIRSSIAQKLEGPTVEVVGTSVLEELRERLSIDEQERPPTPTHTTTLRVRTAEKVYVLKMHDSDTIATVRDYIDKLRGSASDYQLKSAFPSRTFSDPSLTLAQCRLSPSANLFIVNT